MVMIMAAVSAEEARQRLVQADGFVRAAIELR
jgi:N-acetylmuramic acid 6-phosphate (MurNAc-6-P) etherase